MILGKSRQDRYPVGQKFCQNCSSLLHFQDKAIAFVFYAEIQDGCQSGGKTMFAKTCQWTLQIPCGSKNLSKSLYLAPFLR